MSAESPDEALNAWLQGGLTGAARAALSARVAGDPALRAELLAQRRVHLLLVARLAAPPSGLVAAQALAAVRARPARVQRPIPGVRSRAWWRFRPWAAAAVLIGAVGILALWLHAGAAAQAPVASISAEEGGRFSLIGSAGPRSAADAQVLAGDVIQVERGAVTLRFHDGSSLQIRAGSLLTVIAAQSAGALAPAKELRLERGTVEVIAAAQPAGRPLVLRSPQACVTVRGTRFELSALGSGSLLRVEEGQVAFAGLAGEELAVGRGQAAWAPLVGPVEPLEGEALWEAAYPVAGFPLHGAPGQTPGSGTSLLAENRFDELPVCLRRLDGTELIAEEGAWPLTWTANCFQGGRGELGIKPSPIDGRNAMELRNLGDRPGIQLYPWRLPQVAAGSVLHLEITYATVGPGGPEVHVRLDAEDSERVILPPSPGRWSSWSCSFSNGRAAGVLPFIAYVHRDQELWIRSVQLLAEPGTR